MKNADTALYARMIVIGVVLAIPWILLGFPLVEAVTHGLNSAAWPVSAVTPESWWHFIFTFRIDRILSEVQLMMAGRHPAFALGGVLEFWLLFGTWFGSTLHLASPRKKPDWKDPGAIFGDARWAYEYEVRRMKEGLEIGRYADTGQIVRVNTEGNLLSIAPPRSGKTSGLIINNLLAPDQNSWDGPAVVIDPKGDVLRAVGKRRQELGHRIYGLDLRQGARATNRWNPLARAKENDALHLLRMARALIPAMTGEGLYFRERAVTLLAGIIAAAIIEAREEGRLATPADVQRLLDDEECALAIAQASDIPILRSLATDLTLDERIRGSIISTAKLATQWLLDPHLQALTATDNLDLTPIARGQADLFIIVPTEHFDTLAPLVRWLISDLFTAIRRKRENGDRRLLLFIDEAKSLGAFEQLETALGEMPGLGVSTWTFWQSRSQIEKLYGKEGADIFGATAEFSTFSDVGGMEMSSPAFFSELLGDYTADVPGSAEQKSGPSTSFTQSTGKQAARLVPEGDIGRATENTLVLVPNSSLYARRPLRLGKIRYFDDERFETLFRDAAPAARTS